ncbi:UDP-glycosyltransferase 83A1 [Elaeis guineensis]|uniref:UDP-glycosyltransferase 83A1 n=1 Tax=Elaeis guineensis var. tenera TaxID=51953 RepID=A0A6I9S3G7_ELAGV|nr:UDP-glycosyltransferase 83A1 [Elaeis guineensis]
MSLPHALILPYPAQGHVIPLLELSYCLIDNGFKITFVNTENNHKRVLANLSKKEGEMKGINLVAVPDGLESEEDRKDLGRVNDGFLKNMPICLEELIRRSNESEDDRITCMIIDVSMGWALEIAKKMGLRAAAFWPASAGILATTLSIPKLIENGVIDPEGTLKQQMFQLDADMPPMNSNHLVWTCFSDPELRPKLFNYTVNSIRAVKIAEHIICNSFKEIELPAFTYAPNIIPVGPLLTGERFGKPIGHFWPEDATCMAWLDEQPANSVIYVAFGSFTIFNQIQFQELALGLELSGRTFLWVVRLDLTSETSDAYPEGFRDRVMTKGRMVGWAPQQKVLAHPSISCFISHCGWNSTLEGVRNGVPFLCWPYFADQFLNQSYICDIWRIGLQMIANESGIITKEHIKLRVEELLGDKTMRARALELKEIANRSVIKGGSSFENLKSFADAMK